MWCGEKTCSFLDYSARGVSYGGANNAYQEVGEVIKRRMTRKWRLSLGAAGERPCLEHAVTHFAAGI